MNLLTFLVYLNFWRKYAHSRKFIISFWLTDYWKMFYIFFYSIGNYFSLKDCSHSPFVLPLFILNWILRTISKLIVNFVHFANLMSTRNVELFDQWNGWRNIKGIIWFVIPTVSDLAYSFCCGCTKIKYYRFGWNPIACLTFVEDK